jgi:glycylpeptide N-tetradecanoyltransferase
MSFWRTQPVNVIKNVDPQQILSEETLLAKVTSDISGSKIKLDYTVYDTFDEKVVSDTLEFINNNYVGSETSQLIYSKSLLEYFLKDSLLIHFHAKGKTDKIVGSIIGKKRQLHLLNKTENVIDVNFLCLIKNLRNLHLAPYLIGVLTKETVIRLNISLACYTIGADIKSPSFGSKQMYHRPAHLTNLRREGFLPKERSPTLDKQYGPQKDTYPLTYINNNTSGLDVDALNTFVVEHYKQTYTVFDYKSLEEIFSNPYFHTFIFGSLTNPSDILSFYRIDILDPQSKGKYKNGYLYINVVKSSSLAHIKKLFDSVATYCSENNILDMLTLTDIFENIDYPKANFVNGTGTLNYYMFNMDIPKIANHQNGLITI